MNAPKVRFIPDLVEEHFDELQFLWGQRREAIRSPSWTVRSFRDLEERIEGHTRGILSAGENARPLLEAGLAAKDPVEVFASAYLLLRIGDAETATRIVAALPDAKGGVQEALRDALSHAPIEHVVDELRAIVAFGSPSAAVAAATVLSTHRKLAADERRLGELLRDEDPAVRRDAWGVVRIVDAEVST